MPIDYKRYPAARKSEIEPAIHARSGDRCECQGECGGGHAGERCGAPNGAVIVRSRKRPSQWARYMLAPGEEEWTTFGAPVRVVLTVAHLDHDEHNHSVGLDRLRHFCQRCHLLYDEAEHAARRVERRDVSNGQTFLAGFEPRKYG